jgi:ATP-dependent helicase/DNAse subunit B
VGTTNNFRKETPRKLFLGPFQPCLETALAEQVAACKQAWGPLALVRIIVPTHLLAVHLRRVLAASAGLGGGHINLRFQTLTEMATERIPEQSIRIAPRLGLELLCDQIAKGAIPQQGYFASVRETRGFRAALLETFKDLKQAGIGPKTFHAAASSKKLRELAAAYSAFCDWLDQHEWGDEADMFELAAKAPSIANEPPTLLYGFYDLTTVQRNLVGRIAPAAVFFPHDARDCEYSEPLRKWFEKLGYQTMQTRRTGPAPELRIVSAPGETSETREAIRAALEFVESTGKTFNDVAILCRSREQYDTILRDTLAQTGVNAFFRGGRPLSEHSDAKRLLLFLEAIRSNFSRSDVMELASYIGPHSHWEGLSVRLGIVDGETQWLSRLQAAMKAALPGATKLLAFVEQLFAAGRNIPRDGRWPEFTESVTKAFLAFGGRHQPVIDVLNSLAELDAFQSPVSFSAFVDACIEALDSEREQPGSFQGGNVFVGDVMGARGLSWPLVIVVGLVEKSFPRVVREDPLLLDEERHELNQTLKRRQLELPLKLRGREEERLLFRLTAAAAGEKLVLSYPRIEPATARPRVPSFLLLDFAGVTTFESLEKLPNFTKTPMSAIVSDQRPIDERELDLGALHELAGKRSSSARDYLEVISSLLPAGLQAEQERWGKRTLTRHDGLIEMPASVKLLRERFGLENLVISATSLEDFTFCPFFYFQKHVLGLDPWEEPERAMSIDPFDLGSLYHEILEEFFKRMADAGRLPLDPKKAADYQARLRDTADQCLDRFEREGVTGYPSVWGIKREMIREELATFLDRELSTAGNDWLPSKFEYEFEDVPIAINKQHALRLRGKIDRIDLSKDGRRARIFDYKTGKVRAKYKEDSFAGGQALQLPLYILAAEQLLAGVTVAEASYLFLTLRGGYRRVGFAREALTQREGELTGILNTAARMIRDGVFAQYATQDGCRNCDFRPICGNGILKLYERKSGAAQMADFREMRESIE